MIYYPVLLVRKAPETMSKNQLALTKMAAPAVIGYLKLPKPPDWRKNRTRQTEHIWNVSNITGLTRITVSRGIFKKAHKHNS